MPAERTFADLVAEGDSVPTQGWDFSWFDGRATEERPAWGYARLLAGRLGQAAAVLDIQTGGGEVLAGALAAAAGWPAQVRATESWPPNLELARTRLEPYGGTVDAVSDDADLPFGRGTFDLVVSRHPTLVRWPEIARVLAPGGSYFSQQVGAGTNRELTNFMMGPQPVGQGRAVTTAVAEAASVGLTVLDLREQALRVEFFDLAAVIYFLRKVLWTVPGFTVAGYIEPLRRMHEHIRANGSFVCYSRRYLIEARKPA